jgi:transcriptional regulator with XRE-family HTH domain
MSGKEPWDRRRAVLQRMLREMRIAAGLKQDGLAARIRSDQSFVSRFERGERRLDLVELARICEACGTSVSVFVKRFEAECRRQ